MWYNKGLSVFVLWACAILHIMDYAVCCSVMKYLYNLYVKITIIYCDYLHCMVYYHSSMNIQLLLGKDGYHGYFNDTDKALCEG